MFDSPGVWPWCLAPLIGALIGVLAYVVSLTQLLNVGPDAVQGKVHPAGAFIAGMIVIIATPAACFGISIVTNRLNSTEPWLTPSTDDFVGAYQVDPDADFWVHFPEHSLVINSDGTFQANHLPSLQSLPRYWYDPSLFNVESTTVVDGTGTWMIERDPITDDDLWHIVVEFREVNGQSEDRSMRFSVVGHLPPYTLLYHNEYGAYLRLAKN